MWRPARKPSLHLIAVQTLDKQGRFRSHALPGASLPLTPTWRALADHQLAEPSRGLFVLDMERVGCFGEANNTGKFADIPTQPESIVVLCSLDRVNDGY